MATECMGDIRFRDCADPSSAIPSAECDRALAALQRAIADHRNPIVLLGPIGAGKTLLLRRMALRPPLSVRTIFLPWLNVSGEDVLPWIRGFGGTAGGEDFVGAARAFHARGTRTLLLVDEAQGMTRDSAKYLAKLVSQAEGAVQVLLAGTDQPSLKAAAEAFQGTAEYIELGGQVTPEEVSRWVHDTFGADHPARRKDLDWAELVQKAEGVPRLVRWELERRLTTGDLAVALAREPTPPLGGRAEETPIPTSEEGMELSGAPPATLERSDLSRPLDLGFPRLGNLSDGLHRLALWSGEVLKQAGGVARRQTPVLLRSLSQIGNALLIGVERLGELQIHIAKAIAARSQAALKSARILSAHSSSEFLRTAKSASLWIAEGLERLAVRLRRAALHTWQLARAIARIGVRMATEVAAAIEKEASRGENPDLVHATSVPSPSPQLLPKRARTPYRMPTLGVESLAALALVAAGAFLLGRATAPPHAGATRGFTPVPPPITASAPAGKATQAARTPVALPGSATGDNAQQPAPDANAPPSVQTTPGNPAHVLVKIDAHPRARIWIDGREVGRTPLARVHLAPGRHRFLVVFADGRRINRTLEIRQGTHVVKFS